MAERQNARMSKITNDGWLNPVWHRMHYSCTRMTTLGTKGITYQLEHEPIMRCYKTSVIVRSGGISGKRIVNWKSQVPYFRSRFEYEAVDGTLTVPDDGIYFVRILFTQYCRNTG